MRGWRRRSLLLAVAAASFALHAASSAANVTGLEYDAKADRLIIKIAYRGTHANHAFSVEWGECKRLDDERSQTHGLLVDSDPKDPARQEFSKVLEIDLAKYSCRPAKLTIRTDAGFLRSVDIPAPKK